MSEKIPAAPIAPTQMNVLKRNGSLEPVNLDKILKAITRAAQGIEGVDPARVAIETISGVVDGISIRDLDAHSIATAVRLIAEKDAYSTLAAVLTIEVLRKEVVAQGDSLLPPERAEGI